VPDREKLRDVSAHRHAGHVRCADAEIIENRDNVEGHVAEVVCRLEVVRAAGGLAQPDVAVVRTDHEEPCLDEQGAEALVPADELRSAAVQQHERPIRRIAGGLVVDGDSGR
jgi:hypothetical protein